MYASFFFSLLKKYISKLSLYISTTALMSLLKRKTVLARQKRGNQLYSTHSKIHTLFNHLLNRKDGENRFNTFQFNAEKKMKIAPMKCGLRKKIGKGQTLINSKNIHNEYRNIPRAGLAQPFQEYRNTNTKLIQSTVYLKCRPKLYHFKNAVRCLRPRFLFHQILQ